MTSAELHPSFASTSSTSSMGVSTETLFQACEERIFPGSSNIWIASVSKRSFPTLRSGPRRNFRPHFHWAFCTVSVKLLKPFCVSMRRPGVKLAGYVQKARRNAFGSDLAFLDRDQLPVDCKRLPISNTLDFHHASFTLVRYPCVLSHWYEDICIRDQHTLDGPS
jgi:hypothetical protein